MLMINHYYFDSGGGGGVMMVVVWDHSGLLVFFPGPHQYHGDVFIEVMVDRENENYEDEMRQK
jgi:hypothetical protein